MFIHNHYSQRQINTLNELADYADKAGVAEGNRKSYMGRFTWWVFLEDIELIPANTKLDSNNLLNQYPNNLKEFVSLNCAGNIDKSVLEIDCITRHISRDVESTKLFDLLDHLQVMCSFIRDLSTIVKRSKHRPERYVKNEDTINAVVNNRPIGPRTPTPILSGFCLVCHRICSSEKYYCELHTSSTGPQHEIKKSQRMINNAFSNLGLKLSFEHSIDETNLSTDSYHQEVKNIQKDLNISKEMAFRNKSYALEGWAKNHSDHKKFHLKMLENIKKHKMVLDKEVQWVNSHVDFFNDVIQITKMIPHLSKTFHMSFIFKEKHGDIASKLLKQVFYIDSIISITPSTAITMLYRMSQMNLIRLASTKKGTKQFLNEAS